MAQIIDIRTNQSRQPTGLTNKCCSRCGADVWHMRENGEIYCADCEQKYPISVQVNIEYFGER